MGLEDKVAALEEPEPKHFHVPVDSGKLTSLNVFGNLAWAGSLTSIARDTLSHTAWQHGGGRIGRNARVCMRVVPVCSASADPCCTGVSFGCCEPTNAVRCAGRPAMVVVRSDASSSRCASLKLTSLPRRAQEQSPEALFDPGHSSQVSGGTRTRRFLCCCHARTSTS